jgi:hypothetical protein
MERDELVGVQCVAGTAGVPTSAGCGPGREVLMQAIAAPQCGSLQAFIYISSIAGRHIGLRGRASGLERLASRHRLPNEARSSNTVAPWSPQRLVPAAPKKDARGRTA